MRMPCARKLAELQFAVKILVQAEQYASGLDERPPLTDFDWRFNPKLPRSACFELHTLKFIAEGANALIIGKPGTGTHRHHTRVVIIRPSCLEQFDRP